jgi:hypothetical protein
LNEFRKNITGLVQTLLLSQPQHGIFLDSSRHHCGEWDGLIINGMTSGAALNLRLTHGTQKVALGSETRAFFNKASRTLALRAAMERVIKSKSPSRVRK